MTMTLEEKKNSKKINQKFVRLGRGDGFGGTSPTKPSKTVKAMPTTNFIPPPTAPIPDDELPFTTAEAEPVDVDDTPDAVPVLPDAEVD